MEITQVRIFPVEEDKAITLRHCFTHSPGLDGHFEWRGVYNPCLDNIIANVDF